MSHPDRKPASRATRADLLAMAERNDVYAYCALAVLASRRVNLQFWAMSLLFLLFAVASCR